MVDVIRVKSSEQRFNALFMSMSSWWIRRRGMFLHLKNRPPGAFLEHWNLNTARRLLMQYGRQISMSGKSQYNRGFIITGNFQPTTENCLESCLQQHR
jgi:hypothetical protein